MSIGFQGQKARTAAQPIDISTARTTHPHIVIRPVREEMAYEWLCGASEANLRVKYGLLREEIEANLRVAIRERLGWGAMRHAA